MKNLMLTTVLATAAMTSTTMGDFIDPSFVVTAPSLVSIEFVSQRAGATGSLYFVGVERDGIVMPQPDSDDRGLGQFMFSNHDVSPGTSWELGLFQPNDQLDFGYLITRGRGGARTGDVTRTDVESDWGYFRQQSEPDDDGAVVTTYGLEDIKNPRRSDWDFNDVMFQIRTMSVPTPAPLTMQAIAISAICVYRRRRPA